MKLMSNYDIAIQLLKIICERDFETKTAAKSAPKLVRTSKKAVDKILLKDTFEKGSKINEKSTCI